ncbi:hypothetical protein [Streptomyces sp. NBC_00280]|uniref:hypothetical protein n=1 Tax=Streptomyces sp. NBC_00280 TaxID=2975699 RepID=UPI003250800D
MAEHLNPPPRQHLNAWLRRITTVGSQAFLQHTLTAALHSGGRFRMPAMMRLEIDSEGLVARIEEYFDSRVLDSLAEAS